MTRTCPRAFVALIALLAAPLAVRAQEPPASEYMRASWTEKDGLPGSAISSMAQDGDGYLWLISSGGLVRFDGVRFVEWNATGIANRPRIGASTLATGLDGSLLMGMGNGGVARLLHGNLTLYQPEDGGLSRSAVRTILEDHEHTLWAGGQGLTRFRNGRWEHLGASAGLSDDPVYSVFEDRSGTLWVGSAAGVFRRNAGTDRFELVRDVRALGFSDDPKGRVWMTALDHPFRSADRPMPEVIPAALLQTASGGWTLRRDTRGNIWVATLGAGVWRVHALEFPGTPLIEKFDRDRLSSAVVRSVIEDREGNIWVGTDNGLNRLTPTELRSQQSELGKINKPVVAVAADQSGHVWVGTQTGLYEFSEKGGVRYDQRDGLPFAAIYTLHIDRQGTVWAAGDQLGLVRREKNGRFTAINLPGPPLRILAMTADWSGALYICDTDLGIFQWKDGALTDITKDKSTKAAYSAITDREGRVWFGMAGGIVLRIDPDGTTRTFGSDEGLGRGAFWALFEDRDGVVWAGGTAGVSRFADGRFTTMPVEGNRRRQNVVAIAQDMSGDFWLGVRSGVMRVPRADMDAAVKNPSRPIQQPLYDTDDGLNGLPIWLGYPTVTRAGDGRLWFVTSDGVSTFDPRLISKHRLPPSVQVETITADDARIVAGTQQELPPLTSRLEIDYTGISFTVPAKVEFRYKLEGFDADWVDAGTRRQAFYTNLPPRSYRFHVIAGNDGVWNETGAALSFAILPAFYQTAWFRLVVLATMVFAAWGAWRLRVRRVREQFDMVLAERARMAREIHDTLLQSLVGVTLQFDALSSGLDQSSSPLRREIDRLRKQLEQCIREARQSILDLRTAPGEGDLAAAIRQVIEKQTRDAAVSFDLAIVGTPRPSGPRVTQQLLRIAQEAVTNAMRHADATSIRIELCYDAGSVALRVSDNGRGFDPARPVFAPEDHWGLANMKERADQIGAQFRLTSSPGAGTEIETIVSTAP